MKEQEEYLWNKIINILAENPDIFPITNFIINSNRQTKREEDWLKYQLKTFCNIQTVFQKYYKALSLFWDMGDINFKDSFNRNIISNVQLKQVNIELYLKVF